MGSSTKPTDPISTVMAKATITIRTTETLAEAASRIAENDIGTIPVMMGIELVGVLSERDLVRAMAEGADFTLDRAADRMSQSVVSIDENESIAGATVKMLDGGIRHLPVTSKDKLIGMISIRDLLATYQ